MLCIELGKYSMKIMTEPSVDKSLKSKFKTEAKAKAKVMTKASFLKKLKNQKSVPLIFSIISGDFSIKPTIFSTSPDCPFI